MGRGGGVGGGGSRGSFGGGGRGSFGRMGSSRGGFSGGSFGGTNGHRPPPPRSSNSGLFMGYMLGRMSRSSGSGGGSGPRRQGGGSGCLTAIVTMLAVVLLLIFVVILATGGGSSSDITKSTVAREPLTAGAVNETEYYTDELGWIGNSTRLEAGMKNFYQQTGVQPYLYITGTIDGGHDPTQAELEAFAAQKYDELFTDEAHLLLVFFEYYPSQYDTWCIVGSQAKTVIDSEAANILLDYIDRYYYSDLSDEEMFSKAFDAAGERIMTVTKSPWITVWIVVGVLAIMLVAFVWWRSYKKQRNREDEETRKILEMPLDSFGSDEAEELAKKYERDGNDPSE